MVLPCGCTAAQTRWCWRWHSAVCRCPSLEDEGLGSLAGLLAFKHPGRRHGRIDDQRQRRTPATKLTTSASLIPLMRGKACRASIAAATPWLEAVRWGTRSATGRDGEVLALLNGPQQAGELGLDLKGADALYEWFALVCELVYWLLKGKQVRSLCVHRGAPSYKLSSVCVHRRSIRSRRAPALSSHAKSEAVYRFGGIQDAAHQALQDLAGLRSRTSIKPTKPSGLATTPPEAATTDAETGTKHRWQSHRRTRTPLLVPL
jgi:hypothetical protein